MIYVVKLYFKYFTQIFHHIFFQQKQFHLSKIKNVWFSRNITHIEHLHIISPFFRNIVMLPCSVIYWIIIPKRNRHLRTWIGDNCFLKLPIIECWGWQSQGYHNVWHLSQHNTYVWTLMFQLLWMERSEHA
jgi:hypothetical protein